LLILCSVCAGIYGKLSFDASQRMRELGVRSALGATPTDLAALLLGSGLRLLGGGMALGIAAVFASSKLTSKFLFDTSGSDPLIIGAVAAILFLAGMSAMFVASRRATVIDPAAALRSE
jgi:ABC-type antimicrobial peptide transport system permease subunit